MNDVAFVTRFHYPEGHSSWNWRLKYYASETLPRMLNQTDQGFDIWVWCEPHHVAEVRALSDRIQTFWAPHHYNNERFIQDFNPYENTVGLPKYPVQIGLDSDDLVSPRIVEKVRSSCVGDKSILVSFQPVLLNTKTRIRYRMRRQYGPHCGSAIFALYQPDFSDYKFAYHTSHRLMPQLVQHTEVVPEGYVLVSVHDDNDSTKIHKRAVRYRGPAI